MQFRRIYINNVNNICIIDKNSISDYALHAPHITDLWLLLTLPTQSRLYLHTLPSYLLWLRSLKQLSTCLLCLQPVLSIHPLPLCYNEIKYKHNHDTFMISLFQQPLRILRIGFNFFRLTQKLFYEMTPIISIASFPDTLPHFPVPKSHKTFVFYFITLSFFTYCSPLSLKYPNSWLSNKTLLFQEFFLVLQYMRCTSTAPCRWLNHSIYCIALPSFITSLLVNWGQESCILFLSSSIWNPVNVSWMNKCCPVRHFKWSKITSKYTKFL